MTSTRGVETLIKAIATGDEVAFSELWGMLGGQVARLATKFLGSSADGDDVAQDAFLKIWKQASKFDPSKGTGRTWVFAIARNASRDALRRQRVRWAVGLDELPSEPSDDAPSALVDIAARERLRVVQGLLLELPDKQRMVLLLATVGDLETREIAEILGRSRGAVEQLIVRARQNLRKRMEAKGHA